MSIHLETVPLPIARISNALYLDDIGRFSTGMDFRVQSEVTDMNILNEILANSLLGFKNKRSLEDFNKNGVMYFYYVNGIIEIAFFGTFPKRQTIQFIENINREFFIRTNQYNRLEQLDKKYHKTEFKVEKEVDKSQKIEKKEISEETTLKKEEYIPEEEVEEIFEEIAVVEEEPPKKFVITTNMKNIDYLEEVRNESYLGFNSKEELKKFLNTGEILPSLNSNATYDMIFIGDYDEKEAKVYVKNLQEEYALKVQEKTYEQLLEKIKEKNYSLESEIIDSEDSIVLTLNIGK